jgi:hypothetical protein
MQPYYMAWCGFFEQIKLADVYVFYDDVQYVKRSLMSRVDIKTQNGTQWLTVPLKKVHQEDLINNVLCHEESDWRKDHLRKLEIAYKNAPFFNEMMGLAQEIYDKSSAHLIDVTITAIKEISKYFNLIPENNFYYSSSLGIEGKSTQRLFDIASYFGADVYLTGMGALRYMDFNIFERGNIKVEFIDYAKTPYPQLHGAFNPFVTILDLIANIGKDGIRYMNSTTTPYEIFVNSNVAKEYLKNWTN